MLWKAIKRKPIGPRVWRQTHTQPSVSQFLQQNWACRSARACTGPLVDLNQLSFKPMKIARTEESSANQNTSREPERASRECRSLAGSDGLFDFRMDQPPSLTANGSTWSLLLALQTLITWEAHPHPHVEGFFLGVNGQMPGRTPKGSNLQTQIRTPRLVSNLRYTGENAV